jgi:hypothetical protein
MTPKQPGLSKKVKVQNVVTMRLSQLWQLPANRIHCTLCGLGSNRVRRQRYEQYVKDRHTYSYRDEEEDSMRCKHIFGLDVRVFVVTFAKSSQCLSILYKLLWSSFGHYLLATGGILSKLSLWLPVPLLSIRVAMIHTGKTKRQVLLSDSTVGRRRTS